MKRPGGTNDEWFGELWRNQLPCVSEANSTCSPRSLNESQVDLDWRWPKLCRVYDGVYVFATAMHKAVVDNCPEVFSKPHQQLLILKDCLNGVRMLSYLKVRVSGYPANLEDYDCFVMNNQIRTYLLHTLDFSFDSRSSKCISFDTLDELRQINF